jgi:hypothetical protein
MLWGGRSSPGLLQRPWTYFIAGGALIAVGAFAFVTAQPAHPVKIVSQVADYQVETKNDKYYANHLKLAGDSTDYIFDATEFQPSPPDTLQADAPITIWVDRGTRFVLAIELAGQTYSKHAFRDPNFALEDTQHGGEGLAVAGLVVIAIGFLVRWLMNRRTPPAPPLPETERYTVPEGRGRLVP